MNLPSDLTFMTPARLLLLIGVALFVAAYLVVQRRRTAYAVKFTNLALLDRVAPRRPGWRRHVPALLFVLSLATLIVGFAQPWVEQRVPKERATIILAVDTSISMQATDVAPTRIAAAKDAASSFVDLIPPKINVGLVAFNGSATVKVAPTTDHNALKNGIATLQLGERTAIGDAITASLDAVKSMPNDGQDTPAPARIVLMSDGKSTSGGAVDAAVTAANDAGVPISTIAFGTDDGTVVLPEQSATPIPVPVDREALQQIATDAHGTFSNAYTADELDSVYQDIGSSIGYTTEQVDASAAFTGLGLAVLTLCGALSLLWFSRLP
jgi:Ca-activated chloride channel family protein